jgi:molecular chaperone GrpE
MSKFDHNEDGRPIGDEQGDTPVFDVTPEEETGPAIDAGTSEAQPQPAASSAELDKLRAERDELNEKLLRTVADYQNYVRRSAREYEQTRHQRTVDIARALVTALDHFDLALGVDPAKANAADLLNGVGSIRDEIVKALSQFGVNKVVVQPSEEFDPTKHEALMHQPHEQIESQHVIMTLMPGYYVNDTPVRPAQVSVAQ